MCMVDMEALVEYINVILESKRENENAVRLSRQIIITLIKEKIFSPETLIFTYTESQPNRT
jgi:DUF4097 and DUF4098 domain-containing protein YvlB